MKKQLDLNVKTYLRLDMAMMESLPTPVRVVNVHGHRCVWLVDATSVEAQEFARNNKDGCFLNENFIELRGKTLIPHEVYVVGVSFSNTSKEVLKKLISPVYLMQRHHSAPHSGTPTVNPMLHVNMSGDGWYFVPTDMQWADVTLQARQPAMPAPRGMNAVEAQWADTWKGHDWYYQYSDSQSVWRNGENFRKQRMAEGTALGISNTRMEAILKIITPK